MSNFTAFDHFKRHGHWEWWKLKQPQYVLTKSVLWEFHWKGSGDHMFIPVGTVFDLSVPWYLWWFLCPNNRKYLLAAAVHDTMLVREYDPAFSALEFQNAMRARSHDDWRIKFALMGVIWRTV